MGVAVQLSEPAGDRRVGSPTRRPGAGRALGSDDPGAPGAGPRPADRDWRVPAGPAHRAQLDRQASVHPLARPAEAHW